MINFCFDHFVNGDHTLPWPNLVPYDQSKIYIGEHGLIQLPTDWGVTEPWSGSPMLLDFLTQWTVPYKNHETAHAPTGSFYLVDVSFFDSNTDFFSYLSQTACDRLKNREIKLLFTYGEAGDMAEIQQQIFHMCNDYDINPVDVMVTMGSSMLLTAPVNFIHMNEDFFLYQYRQSRQYSDPEKWHGNARNRVFTLLNRAHKDWRAHFCAWFWHRGYHKHSYFSYHGVDYQDSMSVQANTSVIQHWLDERPTMHDITHDFLTHCPFVTDEADTDTINKQNHRTPQHFRDSYWNLVMETHMQIANNYRGVFITEKTWKPIANAQPFIILGCAHSLKYLRDLGYRTFYEIGIDESYDDLVDSGDRFSAVCDLVDTIFSYPAHIQTEIMHNAREIVEHNQNLFWSSAKTQLTSVIDQINMGRAQRTYY